MPRNLEVVDNHGFCPQCKIVPVIRKKNYGTMPRCQVCLESNKMGRYARTKVAIKQGIRLHHYNKEGVRYSVAVEHRTYLRKKLLRFGLTQEWYESQAKECGICKSKTSGRKADWAFDHDHKCCKLGCSKCFRGILCHDCNQALGMMKDDPTRLQKAIEWVTKSK